MENPKSFHQRFNIISPKLDKLWRRKESTDKIHTDIIVAGLWTDYDTEVAKPLDNWLKAHDEYWTELDRIIKKMKSSN